MGSPLPSFVGNFRPAPRNGCNIATRSGHHSASQGVETTPFTSFWWYSGHKVEGAV
jgi:hypothetical protein